MPDEHDKSLTTCEALRGLSGYTQKGEMEKESWGVEIYKAIADMLCEDWRWPCVLCVNV